MKMLNFYALGISFTVLKEVDHFDIQSFVNVLPENCCFPV